VALNKFLTGASARGLRLIGFRFGGHLDRYKGAESGISGILDGAVAWVGDVRMRMGFESLLFVGLAFLLNLHQNIERCYSLHMIF
jgi:hypothetical protein